MNLPTFLITLLFLAVLFYASVRMKRESAKDVYEEEQRSLLKWVSRGFFVMFFGLGLITVLAFFDVRDPFQGKTIGNRFSGSESASGTPVKPDLKGIAVQPNVNAVRDEHQRQLKEFESK